MVNPIWLIIITLGVSFFLGLIDKAGKKISLLTFYLTLTILFGLSVHWFYHLAINLSPVQIYTAGFEPPFSINLRMGLAESFFVLMTNLIGLLGAVYLFNKLKDTKVYALSLYLTLLLGMNGLILTRDIFNIFVFMEITAISTYAIIGLERNLGSLSAGFKYLIAGGIASALFLIGTIYIYRMSGSLNLDFINSESFLTFGKAGAVIIYIFLVSLLIELKSFPINGWALDLYQAVDPGIMALLASASAGAMFFVLYKIIHLLNANLINLVMITGFVTFFFSNLIGLKQTSVRRMLGYSSIAQMGLLTGALAFLLRLSIIDLEISIIIIIGGLFINHFLAKAGLFWLAGIVDSDRKLDWSILKQDRTYLIVFATFIFALVGFPPFPGFWAKWELVTQLIAHHRYIWLAVILLGSLFEVIYLLKWFGIAVKGNTEHKMRIRFSQWIPGVIFFILLFVTGLLAADNALAFNSFYLIPLMYGAVLYILDDLPGKVKAILVLLILGAHAYQVLPGLEGINQVFAGMFLIGGMILIPSTMARKGKNSGLYPLLILLITSLGNIVNSGTLLEFFLSWELMTISSYLLIMRGTRAEKPSLRYITFSTAGAFLILVGIIMIYTASGTLYIDNIESIGNSSLMIFILLALGFLIKSGSIGFHIWVPGAYGEAEDDFSGFLSSLLSKAGIIGLFIFGIIFVNQFYFNPILYTILGWIGVATAFWGALLAVFQEDIKKLLAYSSISQVGYMVMMIATNTHLGWVSAFYLALTHFLFKGILFVAAAGIIYRTGTRTMYKMGGLIKKMPISFITVLIAIIAVSGVPPLSGFGGKWLLYTALIEKGWYLQAGLAFFASAVAFLYLFRLIHTVFLGQLKTAFRSLKEAPVLYLIPQLIFVIIIMAISMYPNLILKPLISGVSGYFGTTIKWEGYKVISSLGYWNGNIVMMITMGVFMIPLIWLLLRVRSVKKVKQFNIVYAAERPDRPETTHFAYNFFGSYKKALGFLVHPLVTRFWRSVEEITLSLAGTFRHIYTGNGQTYALHILLFLVIIYFIMGVN